VSLRAGAVEVADDRGHAGLVAHGGGQVDGLLSIVLGEAVVTPEVSFQFLAKIHGREKAGIRGFHLRLDLSPVAGSALARQVRQRAMARGLVLWELVSIKLLEPNFRCSKSRNAPCRPGIRMKLGCTVFLALRPMGNGKASGAHSLR
jgi:hypothetical protein